MNDVSRYTAAQAAWLAREYPWAKIDPATAVKVEFEYEMEKAWSDVTFSSSCFYITVTHSDGRSSFIDASSDGLKIDLTRMIVEGLAMLAGQTWWLEVKCADGTVRAVPTRENA